jgi:hypothetical protein
MSHARRRSADIWAIFENVFGGSTRLQKILSTWGFVCSGSWGSGCGGVALNSSLSVAGVAAAADAVAVTGYFDCGLGQNPTLEAQVCTTRVHYMWVQVSDNFLELLTELVP